MVERQLVATDGGPRGVTLDVDAVRVARENRVVCNVGDILGQRLDHNASTLEMGKGAVLDEAISINCQ